MALPAILGPCSLQDEATIDKLLQDPRQTLLRNLQDVEQIGDANARLATNEVEHTVVRATESELGQHGIGLGGEIAIGKEQEFDERDERILVTTFSAAVRCASFWERRCLSGCPRIYVSHVD
jgi:hypothetical protein